MVGKMPSDKSQTTDSDAHNAKTACTMKSRSNEARANAATPRGVMGSQAKAGSCERAHGQSLATDEYRRNTD